jgi:predicted GTPase
MEKTKIASRKKRSSGPHPETVRRGVAEVETRIEEGKLGRFVFLLVGITGVGKSRTINSLFGETVAEVGHWEPTTFKVKRYDFVMNGIKACVIDTPGLCDDLDEAENNQKYLRLMHSEIPQPHCLWYVTNLEDPRVRRDEKAAIKMISEKFTAAVWNHSVIVFTHAGKVANLRVSLKNRSRVIREAIAKHGGATNPDKIPTVPVENDLGYLRRRPALKYWRGDLYSRVVSVIDEQGLLPLMSATSDLVQPSDPKALDEPEDPEAKTRVVLTPTHQKRVIKRINAVIIGTLATIGMTAGAAIGATAAAVGAAIGATIGFFAWIFA